jgi:hypothetical protein
MMNMNATSTTATTADETTADEARAKLVAWWGETLTILEQINDKARQIARHADREESPLYRWIDGEALEYFAGQLGDLTTSLFNNMPLPSRDLADPTEDLPYLPYLPRTPEGATGEAVAETPDHKAEAAVKAPPTDAEVRDIVFEWAKGRRPDALAVDDAFEIEIVANSSIGCGTVILEVAKRKWRVASD